MSSKRMKDLLMEKLQSHHLKFQFDPKKDTIRIENSETGKGITIDLPPIIAKWENSGEKAIDETVYYVEEALKAMGGTHSMQGQENKIFPVIRSTSFPLKDQSDIPFITDEHTAETRIYYALDLGNTYRLIDEKFLEQQGWNPEHLREVARFNVRGLSTSVKTDSVAGNVYHFVSTKDGYDASRILNESWLKSMQEKMEGTMALAVPHQDVLIVADIRNETGYDVLAQMAMSFFASGLVPITALSFLYENGELEPVFILGRNKKNNSPK
ncbi:DUF1444 domain-containing protein [Peribacillus alkalitolerans]|uniref:DUF1444 domain-containing protein n=1 Tax=Peribacillus alkalitolerans TaxID=1550385 RepID=UPI0013CFF6F4|nr:DUF1444 domain-containing protein [Peribacillus alkalitolerans]